jgi:DNA-binding winged helix-turn-helix (wHTH) protein/tetratricopeptide (TPR) repeat protein
VRALRKFLGTAGDATAEPGSYEFAPFRVIPAEGLLLRDGQPVPLAPRAFETLLVLLRNSGRLVTKEALMEAIWPDTPVEEGNLAFNVSVVRKALGDGPDRRYIETVPKRGYRFVGRLVAAPLRNPIATMALVGRGTELAELDAAWSQATSGRGHVVCVTGEPGLGKTTLIERFLQAPPGAHGRALLRGRCSERLAGAGTHLPILEALDDLLAGEAAEIAERMMRSVAPSWHGLLARTSDSIDAASPERLKRELLAFFQQLGRQAPVALVVDDLHWADVSTTDILCYLGHRVGDLPLLIVVGFRASEMVLERHPFLAVQLELEGRRLCRVLPLRLLERDAVAAFIDLAFPDHRFPADLAEFIHGKTDGNPLFMVDVLRDLRDRGTIVADGGGFVLTQLVHDIARELPKSVRAVIDRKVAQLDESARQLLSAASVQGQVFDSTLLAAVMDLPGAEVEDRLAELERSTALVERVAERELPDGTPSLRCRFVHALYQDALHARLTPSRRASLSLAVATETTRHHGDRVEDVSASLASLFEVGRAFDRAAVYFLRAAQAAVQACGYPEAATLARRGLVCLERLPHTPERDGCELALQTILGVASMSMVGFAASDVGEAYERALALSRRLGPTPELFPVLGGLWLFHVIRAKLTTAREIAESILTAAEQTRDPMLLAEAHMALGITLTDMGEPRGALTHFRESLSRQDPRWERQRAVLYALVPSIGARVGAARVLVPLGQPDTALAHVDEGIALARSLTHAPSLGVALNFAAIVHHLRDEPRAALARATQAIELSREHGMAQTLGWGMFWQAWARVELGDRAAIAQMRAAIDAYRASGARISLPQFVGLLAEAVRQTGDAVEPLELLDGALDDCSASDDRYGEPELHLFRSRALADLGRADEARVALDESLATARSQGAAWWELRAAVERVSSPDRSHGSDEALDTALAKFTIVGEGAALPLLVRARAFQGAKG